MWTLALLWTQSLACLSFVMWALMCCVHAKVYIGPTEITAAKAVALGYAFLTSVDFCSSVYNFKWWFMLTERFELSCTRKSIHWLHRVEVCRSLRTLALMWTTCYSLSIVCDVSFDVLSVQDVHWPMLTTAFQVQLVFCIRYSFCWSQSSWATSWKQKKSRNDKSDLGMTQIILTALKRVTRHRHV